MSITREAMQKAIFESDKARFIDECELQMASEVIANISTDELDILLKRIKLFSTAKNQGGFYGVREIAQILSDIIYERCEFLAKNANLANFKGSDDSAFFIKCEYFLKMSFDNLPAWFIDFARSYKEGTESSQKAVISKKGGSNA